ncbi:MAG: polysaccharide export protein EpsE [Rugosibacter sp.]
MNTKSSQQRDILLGFLLALFLLVVMASGVGHAQEPLREYQLGPGDSIHIQVFENPDLTLDTRVSEMGAITFPLIGSVQLGGLTLSAAELAIAQKLDEGKFVVKPQVTVVLVQNHGNQVSVLGQVNHPGRFPLETFNTRLSEILSAAGGITATGADTAILTGVRDGKPFRSEIDISGMFINNKLSEDVRVNGGDVIFVPKAPMFYIYGEVQHPGSYRQERNMMVQQALAQGGGLTPRGTERGLCIRRRGPDGKVIEIKPKPTDMVQADDIIEVSESLF